MTSFYLFFSNAAIAAQCNSTTDGATIAYDLTGNASCERATPLALKVSFYKLALCKSKPTYTDDSSCTYLFNVTTPKTIEIGIGKQVDLIETEISIPEGDYPFAMMMIKNEIGLKSLTIFDNAQNGGNGGNGKTCWTNGNDLAWSYANTADMPINCGSNITANPQFSNETFWAFGNTAGPGFTASLLNQRSITTTFDVHLLKSFNALADVPAIIVGPTNAAYMWGVQKFDITPKITANSKSINLGFKITEGMDITFNNAGGAACSNKCVEGVNLTSFAFTVDVE